MDAIEAIKTKGNHLAPEILINHSTIHRALARNFRSEEAIINFEIIYKCSFAGFFF